MSLLFVFRLVFLFIQLSLLVVSFFGVAELCDREQIWYPTSLFPLYLLTPLSLKTPIEETLASKCFSNFKSEIGLTTLSRSTDSRNTFAILVEQTLHRTSPTLFTSPRSSKRLWPLLIVTHSDVMQTLRKARTSPEPEQKLTTEGSHRLLSNRRFRPPHASSKTLRARGRTLIFLMDSSMNPLDSSPISFLPWPIVNYFGPSHQAPYLMSSSKCLQNPAAPMLRFFNQNCRGLLFDWDSTLFHWIFSDFLHTLMQSSSIATLPEASFHRILLSVRYRIPRPVSSSMVLGKPLSWPRSDYITLISVSNPLIVRYYLLNGRGHRESLVSTSIIWLYDSSFRILALNIVQVSWSEILRSRLLGIVHVLSMSNSSFKKSLQTSSHWNWERSLSSSSFVKERTLLPCCLSSRGHYFSIVLPRNFFIFFTAFVSLKDAFGLISMMISMILGGKRWLSTSTSQNNVTRQYYWGLTTISLPTHLSYATNSLSLCVSTLFVFKFYCTNQKGWIIPSFGCSSQV